MTDIYTKGSCYNLYVILKHVYPQAVAYGDEDHIITEIDGKYYDITGEVRRGDHMPLNQVLSGDALTNRLIDMYNMECELVPVRGKKLHSIRSVDVLYMMVLGITCICLIFIGMSLMHGGQLNGLLRIFNGLRSVAKLIIALGVVGELYVLGFYMWIKWEKPDIVW